MLFEITSNFAALLKSKGLMHQINVSLNRPVQVKFNSGYTDVSKSRVGKVHLQIEFRKLILILHIPLENGCTFVNLSWGFNGDCYLDFNTSRF